MIEFRMVLETIIGETYLESIGKGEPSDTTSSDDDFQVVCHGSGICFERRQVWNGEKQDEGRKQRYRHR
jgi:hypothetical protein